jgi:hypothetical protein
MNKNLKSLLSQAGKIELKYCRMKQIPYLVFTVVLLAQLSMLNTAAAGGTAAYGNYIPAHLGNTGDVESRAILFQPDRELLYDFDGGIPLEGVEFSGSCGEVSREHFMTRNQSLLWHTGEEGALTFNVGMTLQKPAPGFAAAKYRMSLGLFLESRNEQDPVPAFRLELEGKDGKTLFNISFYLHKAGWNMLSVMPQLPDGTVIGKIRLVREKGPVLLVYVDNVFLMLNPRGGGFQTPGILEPTVFYERKSGSESEAASAEEKRAFRIIAERIIPPVLPVARLDENRVKAFEDWYSSWKIESKGAFANGEFPIPYYRATPGDTRTDSSSYYMYIENEKLCRTLKDLGFAYAQCQDAGQKARLRTCLVGFVRLAVTYGCIPSAWYNGRGFVEGVYYGRDALEAEGLLEPISRQVVMQYCVDQAIANLPVWEKPPVPIPVATQPVVVEVSQAASTNGSNKSTLQPTVDPGTVEFLWKTTADDLNTASRSAVLTLLIYPDTREKAESLKKFSLWFSRVALAYAPGANGTLKPDGSWFHHWGNRFDNYGWKGAFRGASDVLFWFSGTPFRIEKEAHERLFHMGEIYQMAIFRDASYGPPDLFEGGTSAYGILLNLARSGTPDGRLRIAPQFASAVLGLIQNQGVYEQTVQSVVDTGSAVGKPEVSEQALASKAVVDIFEKDGIRPPSPTDALFTLSYGGIQFRRLDDWSLVMRGVSKYFYYNQYVRDGFLFYTVGGLGLTRMGQIHASWADGKKQCLRYTKDPGNNDAPLRMEEGYHPSYAPCVTALETEWKNLNQVYYQCGSDPFVGGVTLGKHFGVFVQKFNAKSNVKQYGKTVSKDLSFRKSYFTFDRMVVALGRDIGAGAKQHVFTGILQERSSPEKPGVILGGDGINWKDLGSGLASETMPWAETRDGSLGVWIFPGQRIRREDGELSDTGRPGHMTRLYVEHGDKLENADGQYGLIYYLNPQPGSMAKFAKEMTGASAPIQILQDEKNVQVVTDKVNGATGYAFFGAAQTEGANPVLASDAPCLVMTQLKDNGGKLELALSDPDLHMDRTPDNPFSYSLPTPVRITLKGKWDLKQVVEVMGVKRSEVKLEPPSGGNTVILVMAVDGLSSEMILEAQ